ncbi:MULTISPECIES: hypothetical protein [Aerococcus]|uniref:LPXTG cell wall anchor domain-containing protein n=1 Tax=Aerococcus sanguinicola TaxID=119206 RepID=A0A5N1GIM1_9LACT|nr:MULTISPECIES: hypothetical protein [Aerococcus]KAA9300188.1 hypothetical protein F6I03_08495 [Aerococcus sanguinicola]MDK6369532.1 hypothetical protein [Aerococcus sp. UMB9870]MDK6686099.1 hypothetical protein [Aerococcus sp. UMB8623]MDK6939879.1 hypothetical protein [Aerococcus sp. UMB8487]OFR35740.1 hypothetical protein HMPREF2892_03745 [Aerococcus sp. HMSC061A03]
MSAIKRALLTLVLAAWTTLVPSFAAETDEISESQGRPEDFPSLDIDRPSMEEEAGFVPQEEEKSEEEPSSDQGQASSQDDNQAIESGGPADDLELAQPNKAPLGLRRSEIWSRPADQGLPKEEGSPAPGPSSQAEQRPTTSQAELPKVGAVSRLQPGLWSLVTACLLFLASSLGDRV